MTMAGAHAEAVSPEGLTQEVAVIRTENKQRDKEIGELRKDADRHEEEIQALQRNQTGCAERFRGYDGAIGEIKESMRWANRTFIMTTVGILVQIGLAVFLVASALKK